MNSFISEFAHRVQFGDGALIWFLIKATVVLLCAIGVTFVIRRAAAGVRHLVWLVTLGALLLIPALSVWSPLRIHILPAPTAASIQAPGAEIQAIAQSVTATPSNASSRITAASAPLAASRPQIASQRSMRTSLLAAGDWIVRLDPLVALFCVWLLVALAIGTSLLFAALSLNRVVRASRPLNNQDWLNTIWDVSDRLGLQRVPRLRQSESIKMPFACGVLRPTIVLPAECEAWSQDRRSAVLLHELAHVRRHDLIGHTVGRIACAIYWFHPLVWTAAKRLRSESERACDDLALMCGTHASDYAEHLLEIVTSVRRDRTPMVALAMARRKEFEGRMLAILDPQLRRATPNRWKTGAMVGSLAALSIAVGAAAPVARSTSTATPSPTTEASGTIGAASTRHTIVAPETATLERRSRADTDSLLYAGVGAPHTGSAGGNNMRMPLDVDIGRIAAGASRVASAEAMAALDKLDISFDDGRGNASPDERAQLLAKILRSDTSATLRSTAAWGLARYAESDIASAALAQALRHDASASVREMSAWALARDRDGAPAIVQALASALRADAGDSVRATSAWALGEIRSSAAVPALTSALADKNARVRMRSVWALGELRTRPAPPALVAMLKDSDPKVRELTAWSLHAIRDTATVPALEAALHSETDKDLQADYIHAIASMGEMSVAAIRSLLDSPDPRVKSMAVDVLAGGNASGPWPWPWPDPRPQP